MKPRVLILPVSAAVILALVVWRLDREAIPDRQSGERVAPRELAPRFELYDQHSQLVKFERYLGRTRLLLLFMGDASAADDPLLRQLLDHHAAIENAVVQIVVVGTATPYAIRQAEQQISMSFPFPVLTDVGLLSPEPAPTHCLWGLVGDDDRVRPSLFLIDRDGTVASTGVVPQPVTDPSRTIEMIAEGDWPE